MHAHLGRAILAMTIGVAFAGGPLLAQHDRGDQPASGKAVPTTDADGKGKAQKSDDKNKQDDKAPARNDKAEKRDDDRQHDHDKNVHARPEPPKSHRVVFVGGYFYDPYVVSYPWPPVMYPYYRFPVINGRALLRVQGSPRDASVYVDGFYAGIVDDFDNIFQPLPLLPGGHTVTLYLNGFRTFTTNVYLSPGSTLRVRQDLERLPPGLMSEPPALSAAVPEPPPGTYLPPRTPPRSTPDAPMVAAAPSAEGFGTLYLRYFPVTATVTIDGHEWLTTTPGEFIISLSVGHHVVSIATPGRRVPFTTDVEIFPERSSELNVSVPVGT